MSEQEVKTRGNLVGDVIAGLTTGVANIPDAMASAILAGANPVQGLYAIMIGNVLGEENVFVATPILGASTPAAMEQML